FSDHGCGGRRGFFANPARGDGTSAASHVRRGASRRRRPCQRRRARLHQGGLQLHLRHLRSLSRRHRRDASDWGYAGASHRYRLLQPFLRKRRLWSDARGAHDDLASMTPDICKAWRISNQGKRPTFRVAPPQRPSCRRAAEQRDEIATLHSITSSASASSLSGIWRPSALAVLRLITNSYLVGSTTGRSAGLAPLRISPAYMPAWR